MAYRKTSKLLYVAVVAVSTLYAAAKILAISRIPGGQHLETAAPRGETLASMLSPEPDSQQAGTPLDFDEYRSKIEPIFLKTRAGGVRCYDCHSVLATPLRLQPLSPGASTWTIEQSRQNFAVVSTLVVPSQPMKSPLLLHPLAPEAGGDPFHTGGKFWKSTDDPEWQMIAAWVRRASPAAAATAIQTSSNAAAGTLNFEAFKTTVEPIFLKHRPGHARCYGCHIEEGRIFHLEPLSAGASDWNDEQSRRNFETVLRLVVPGDPTSSRLLMHPLSPQSGGEPFHSGGRQFQSQNDPDWLDIAAWIRNGAPSPSAPAVLIYVTNSAGDTVDVIDSATNKVVQVISGIELPHGVNFSPDGSRVYVSNESESVLDVVDRKSAAILKKVPLSGHPNNITVTKDGRRVLVGIRSAPGGVDVIDTGSLAVVKTIPTDRVHNIYVTPDGKFAAAGSLESHTLTLIDLQSDQLAWKIKLDNSVRPMAFETNPDGSTHRVFAQLSNLNGFVVVDFAARKQVATVHFPDQPGGFGAAEGRMGTPAHGIGIAPDGKTLWANSTVANAVFEYALPDLKLLGYAALPLTYPLDRTPVGSVPEWITFAPDGKFAYDSNSGDRSVSVIDVATRKVVAIVPVGEVPKRINTLVLH